MMNVNKPSSKFGILFKQFVLLLILCCFVGAVQAQRTISGKVTDLANGDVLIGATVMVENTSTGTITDVQGEFTLALPEGSNVLLVSYIGYATERITIGTENTINITLSQGISVGEIVVDALGIEREEKSLGYSAQSLDGKAVSEIKTNNIVAGLSGKVSGVNITSSSNGPTASANINIRGVSSLLGNNQPLFVVNGMPITNDLYSFDDGLNGSSTIDFGNAAQVVNPDDVASINILKGPAASALYGSRAANGVILIETKNGVNGGNKGWGINVNSSVMAESVLKLPNFQDQYGFGGGGKYSYKDGTNYIGANEYYEAYGENWGPRANGQLVKQWNSNGEAVPFNSYPNNVRNFFQTGVTASNNVSINHSGESSDFRLSYTNLNNRGIVPNTGLQRNTLQMSVGQSLFDDKLTIRGNGMYVRNSSDNVPNAGYDESSSIMYGWLWFPRTVPIDDLREYWKPGFEGVQQQYAEELWVNNPWFLANENTNSFQSNRLIGNFRIQYDFNENFNVRLRYGADVVDEQRQYRRAPSTKAVLNGSYREDEISFNETNAEILFGYSSDRFTSEKKNARPDFIFDVKIGGNIMRQDANFLVANNPELKFFGTDASVYTLTNARSGVLVESQKTRNGINSIFGVANIDYKGFLYLDLTMRQDWSSSLVNPIAGLEGSDFSFLYPSASLSWIISDMMDLPQDISFLKLKGAFAQVGNGAPPYSFGTTFTPQAAFGNNSVFTTNGTIADPNLRNESTTAFEVGVDARFMKDRFRVDATYYNMLSFDQVIFLPLATTSGYDFTITNGGSIRNTGIELMLSADVIRNENFSWNITANLGRNQAIVEELPEVINSGRYSIIADLFPGDEGGADLEYVAEQGQLLGQLYGLGFERHPETGEIIHQNGLPMITEDKVSAGSFQPDLTYGIYNTFQYKNWSLGFLLGGQIGGKIYSRTHALMATGGAITNEDDPLLDMLTTDGRQAYSVSYDAQGEPVYTLEDAGSGVVGPGLKWEDANNDGVIDYDSELSPNDIAVQPGGIGYVGYFYTYYGNGFNRDNIEAATYDATYIKLREARISYTVPKGKIGGLQSLTISAVGRNLLLFSNVPSIDPEAFSIRNGLFVNGFESTSLPSTRSFGLSVSIGI